MSDLENRLAVLLGGRAAEEIAFDGDVSTGATDDLDRATAITLDMATRYGMNKTLGARTYAAPPDSFLPTLAQRSIAASEATAREIDVAVRDCVERACARAKDLLSKRQQELEEGVKVLLTKETLLADEFAPLNKSAAPLEKAFAATRSSNAL